MCITIRSELIARSTANHRVFNLPLYLFLDFSASGMMTSGSQVNNGNVLTASLAVLDRTILEADFFFSFGGKEYKGNLSNMTMNPSEVVKCFTTSPYFTTTVIVVIHVNL